MTIRRSLTAMTLLCTFVLCACTSTTDEVESTAPNPISGFQRPEVPMNERSPGPSEGQPESPPVNPPPLETPPVDEPPMSPPPEDEQPERPEEPLEQETPNEHVTSREAEFSWEGVIDTTGTIIIRNVQGPIRVTASPDERVRVRATRTATNSPLDTVEIELHKYSRGLTVCSVYKDGLSSIVNQCRPDGSGPLGADGNDVLIHYEIQVPPGPVVNGQTATGNLTSLDLNNFVHFQSLGGSISIRTSEPAIASTVSGAIDVRMDPSNVADYRRDELNFDSTAGSVMVRIPEDSGVEFYGTSVAGRVSTDFQLNGEGTNSADGVINGGGVRVVASSVASGVALRSH